MSKLEQVGCKLGHSPRFGQEVVQKEDNEACSKGHSTLFVLTILTLALIVFCVSLYVTAQLKAIIGN